MSPAFLPRRIREYESWIRGLANRLVDGFAKAGKTDIVSSYAARIPTAVVGKIVGAPEEDSRQFAHWVDDIFTLTGDWDVPEAEQASAWRGVFAFEDYIAALIADRRRNPQDDLTTDFILARADDGEPAMSDTEVLWNVFNVAAAGSDTTGVLIAQALHLLLAHRSEWDAIREDRSLIPNAVDEAMRLRAPVRALIRRTTAQAIIGGVTIPADSLVLISVASTGHDEQIFPHPERFDVRRGNAKRHLGFGSRIHSCIGAPLARLEAQIAIETLIDRLPDLRMSEQSRSLIYRPNLILPVIDHLHVHW